MRPLFGFEKKSKNDSYAVKYITKTLTKTLENEYNDISQSQYMTKRKMNGRLTTISRYLSWGALFVAILGIVPIFSENVTDKLGELKNNLPYIIISIVLYVVAIILLICNKYVKPSRKLQNTYDDLTNAMKEWEIKRDLYFEFPENKKRVDILVPHYTIKNDQIKEQGMYAHGINLPTICYVENDKLYISDSLSVYEFPISNIEKFVLIEEKTPFLYWNLEEKVTDEKFVTMGIAKNKLGGFSAPNKGRVIFNFEDGKYYFDVLPFDFETISQLTNQTLVKENNQTNEEE